MALVSDNQALRKLKDFRSVGNGWIYLWII